MIRTHFCGQNGTTCSAFYAFSCQFSRPKMTKLDESLVPKKRRSTRKIFIQNFLWKHVEIRVFSLSQVLFLLGVRWSRKWQIHQPVEFLKKKSGILGYADDTYLSGVSGKLISQPTLIHTQIYLGGTPNLLVKHSLHILTIYIYIYICILYTQISWPPHV